MNSFQIKVLNFLSGRNFKSVRQKVLTNYKNAKSVGILINANDEFHRLESLVEAFNNDGKESVVLNVNSIGLQPGRNNFPTVNKSEITFFGNSKSQHLTHFLSQKYDLILLLDMKRDPLIKFICSQFNTLLVSIENTSYFNPDLVIIPDKTRQLEDVLKYLRKLG